MIEGLIGLTTGVVLTYVAALIQGALERKRERLRRIEETKFQVYMRLLNLHQAYFWATIAEVRRSSVRWETEQAVRSQAAALADLLRSEDNVPYLDEILCVLMSNDYESANARYDHMGQIIDHLGVMVNPSYQAVIRQISQNNVAILGQGKHSASQSLVPATMGFTNVSQQDD